MIIRFLLHVFRIFLLYYCFFSLVVGLHCFMVVLLSDCMIDCFDDCMMIIWLYVQMLFLII